MLLSLQARVLWYERASYNIKSAVLRILAKVPAYWGARRIMARNHSHTMACWLRLVPMLEAVERTLRGWHPLESEQSFSRRHYTLLTHT